MSANDCITALGTSHLDVQLSRVMPGGMTYEASILETCMALQDADKDLTSQVKRVFRRTKKLHFQLQVTIGSYGYEPLELYLVHGILAFLALVVIHCILTEVKTVMVRLWG